ncbi:hypothetical protein DFH29DRAFT_877864 [Suillus ampliporus]|nr:hypothetical protein DFH29DRAFT_877864 [Suillus ampliporus]
MAQKDDNRQPKAQWSEAEVDALLDYLITQKSKITGTTFKDEVFNEASNKIAGVGTHGLSKTGPQCEMKWTSGEVAEVQWGQFLSASVTNKMLEILPNGSGAEGTAAYNPASLAAQSLAPATFASAPTAPASAPAASASTEASGSAIPTTSTEASGKAMGLAISVPSTRNASPSFKWDQIMSALPSTDPGMVARTSMNIPPPPLSIAVTHSSTRKHSHSDMALSSITTQTLVLQMDSPSFDKKPKLSTCGGSTVLRVTSQRTGSKATKDAVSTAAFMNLQGSINRLMDSLEMLMSKTDESRVADERSQALDMMQDDERILASDKVTLMNIFTRSPVVCSTYLLSRPENCVPYLESVLCQAANGVYSTLHFNMQRIFLYNIFIGIILAPIVLIYVFLFLWVFINI